MRALIMGLVCLSLGSAAIARDPAFDPRAWKSKVAGEKTQVSVLGSVHLKNLGAFKPDDLLPGNHAICRLARQMDELLPDPGPLGWASSSICRQRRAMCR